MSNEVEVLKARWEASENRAKMLEAQRAAEVEAQPPAQESAAPPAPPEVAPVAETAAPQGLTSEDLNNMSRDEVLARMDEVDEALGRGV